MATDYLTKYADGGALGMLPMDGGGGADPMGGAPMGPGAPAGGDPMATAGGAPPDPAMQGAGSPEDSINQLEQLAGQYSGAPSEETGQAIIQLVMQLFGGGEGAPAGPPAGGGGGAMPMGAPTDPMGGGGGTPMGPPAGGPAFRRGGKLAAGAAGIPVMEMLREPTVRKAKF